MCVRMWYDSSHTHLFFHQLQSQHQAWAPNKAALCAHTDTVWLLAQLPKRCLCWNLNTLFAMGEKDFFKALREEREVFPESHLVLMQGPLVWITSTYYKENSGWPLISIPREMGASQWWGAVGLRAWGAEGWIDAFGQIATSHDWCPSCMGEFVWDLFNNPPLKTGNNTFLPLKPPWATEQCQCFKNSLRSSK